MRRTRIALGALALATALAVAPASAQIIDCTGEVDQPGLKILLDDIAYLGGSGADPRLVDFMLERLRFRLEADLQRLVVTMDAGAGEQPADLKVLRCDGRSPRGEGDFDEDLVNLLRMRDVMVEVWGMVLIAEDGRRLDGLVSYLMPPVRAQSGAPGEGFQQMEYVVEEDAAAPSLDRLFTDSADLRSFAVISLGVMQLEAHQYDAARESFCRALGLLDQATGPAVDSLRDYVEQMSLTVVERARTDPDYQGILLLAEIGGCHGND